MKSCVEQNHLMDLQAQLIGEEVGPLAKAELAAKEFGERCSVGLQETINDAWERLNELDRRDLEDKLRNAELGK
jgi:hypothetical protein